MAEGGIVAAGRPQEVMADRRAMQAARLEATDAFRLSRMLASDRRKEMNR